LDIVWHNPDAHFKLANALVTAGRAIEAIGHYEEVIRQQPYHVKAHNNLAWLLATRNPAMGGNAGRAVVLAERGCRLAGCDSLITFDVLAAAYASAGRFPEAVAAARKALEVAIAAADTSLVRQCEARGRLYCQGRAFRQAINDVQQGQAVREE
jgi:tetratricopeptide (TPR) repeat protein